MIDGMNGRYISQVPDDALPEMAHKIVDDAIKNGGLTLMDGKIYYKKEDIQKFIEKHNSHEQSNHTR